MPVRREPPHHNLTQSRWKDGMKGRARQALPPTAGAREPPPPLRHLTRAVAAHARTPWPPQTRRFSSCAPAAAPKSQPPQQISSRSVMGCVGWHAPATTVVSATLPVHLTPTRPAGAASPPRTRTSLVGASPLALGPRTPVSLRRRRCCRWTLRSLATLARGSPACAATSRLASGRRVPHQPPVATAVTPMGPLHSRRCRCCGCRSSAREAEVALRCARLLAVRGRRQERAKGSVLVAVGA